VLSQFTVIYGENGRGKTTLAAILRSLMAGDPNPILERHRFAALGEPHIVVERGADSSVFLHAQWDRIEPNLVVFDDHFVDTNVHSGLVVESEHRQNLHELIIGARGIALNGALQQCVDDVNRHNQALRERSDRLSTQVRGPFTVEEYCALLPRPNLEETLVETERNLSAVREADALRKMPLLVPIEMPDFDLGTIANALEANLQTLDAEALARLQTHFQSLGSGGEQWVAEGVQRAHPEGQQGFTACPFCTQNVGDDTLVSNYRAYFSESYSSLKRHIRVVLDTVRLAHSTESINDIPRVFSGNRERATFWERFCELPTLRLDTTSLVRDRSTARDLLVQLLEQKERSPAEAQALPEEARSAIERFNEHRVELLAYNEVVAVANAQIALAKEHSLTGSVSSITSDLDRLRAIQRRFTPPVQIICDEYILEKAAKDQTETLRTQARAALDNYRQVVFPAYETAINVYLQRFNAGYRIGSMSSVNNRGGSSCVYNVVINNQPVRVGGAETAEGEPSFRNTLSAGDRNTLALAFFFASLDQDAAAAQKIVVLDDPITSLDDHRQLATAQEVRRLSQRTAQVIVLSHDKSFLLTTWERADRTARCALEVVRVGESSDVRSWDVTRDSITDHDRRHALVSEYVATSGGDRREIAESLRPILEYFIRAAYPNKYPPGTLLGHFHRQSMQRLGTDDEYLNSEDTTELGDLLEYSNRFHHDTNPALAVEDINDAELMGFATRALRFSRRP
jgi:wobble nucleotide-excising tRNase